MQSHLALHRLGTLLRAFMWYISTQEYGGTAGPRMRVRFGSVKVLLTFFSPDFTLWAQPENPEFHFFGAPIPGSEKRKCKHETVPAASSSGTKWNLSLGPCLKRCRVGYATYHVSCDLVRPIDKKCV